MPDRLICARCGSDTVIPRARIVERADDGQRHDVQVEVQRRPNAMLFKRPERSPLSAQVCAACGHVELYTDAPRALYTAYLQADSSPTASAVEELERTREALADSQIRLRELEEKLVFVEQILERDNPTRALPSSSETD